MTDQSAISRLTMCADTSASTSSPASPAGTSPSTSPAGERDLFGQAVPRANPSAPPAKARRPMTNVTCGLRGHLSSPSADLQSFLVNRLKRQLDGAGSILFSMSWKRRATPAHRPFSQLAASARPTSDTAHSGWPTPCAEPASGSQRHAQRVSLGVSITDLQMAAKLAAWPTTTREDARNSARHGYMIEGNTGTTLLDAARMAAWSTPQARDGKGSRTGDELYTDRNGRPLNEQVAMLVPSTGERASGSRAEMAKLGQLNPAHSRWLMGFPAAWDDCAPTVTRSARKSRQSSSGQ